MKNTHKLINNFYCICNDYRKNEKGLPFSSLFVVEILRMIIYVFIIVMSDGHTGCYGEFTICI